MPALRILSYNVRYFGHSTRGLATTRTAVRRIAAAVAALDPLPDIICLQEVETSSIRSTVAYPRQHAEETQLERLMHALHGALVAAGKPDGYEAYYFPAHKYRLAPETHIYTTGLAILAHRSFAIQHHNAAEPHDITHRGSRIHAVRGLKQTRICAHVRFRGLSGDEIDVFNTHFSLPTTFSRAFWTQPARMGWGPNQLEEARNLARFVDRERSSDRFVVVGDFNSLPGSPVYRHLVAEAGWHDAFGELHGLDEEHLRAWPTAGFLRLRMHLDHVFTGRGLRWVDFDGSCPYGDDGAGFRGLSDHMPLIGRCSVAHVRESARPPRPAGAARTEDPT